MAVTVGDAVLKLGVDKRDLDKGLRGIKGTIQKHSRAIGMAMTAAGGAILAAGALSVKTYAAMGDEVAKMAKRTGFSTEALSELRHAAEISGADLSTLEKGVKRMSGTILDAQDGLETYIRAFQHIGIEVQELDGLNPEEQFLRIAESIAKLEDPTKRAAIAQDIFGRAGTALLPLFDEGAEGMARLRQEAHDLGIVFDAEAAVKAEEMTDAMTQLKGAVTGLTLEIGGLLIDTLKPMIDRIKEIVISIKDWMEKHPLLTDIIVKFAGALAMLMVVGGPMLMFAPTIGKIILAGKALVSFTMTRLIPTIIAAATAWWAKVAAMVAAYGAILGPVGIAAALTALGLIIAGTTLAIKNWMNGTAQAIQTTDAFTASTQRAAGSGVKVETSFEDARDALDAFDMKTQEATTAQTELAASINRVTEANKASTAEMIRQGVEAKSMWESVQKFGIKFDPTTTAMLMAGYTDILAWREAGAPGLVPGEPLRHEWWPEGLQQGGIAMRPITARIAEKQPEAVIPLDRLGGMSKKVNIFVELDGKIIARAIGQPLVDEIRLKTGAHI